MRIAVVVALFVVVCAAFLFGVVAPASGQTIPPPTATPCVDGCFPAPTPRPTDGEPFGPTSTPDPACPANDCFPAPTPRPTDTAPSGPTATPNPACPANDCFPFPTPRPTYAPGATIEPAGPSNGTGFWHYGFMPIVGRR
jgi:hypothetical protein